MAFKKTLAERVFNISKISQTLRNCRISSSAVHLRPSANPGERNAGFHDRASEIWSVPVGESSTSLMEKLRSATVSNSRIRLEGFVRMTSAMEGLTEEETRAAEMEMVKAKLREVERTWVTYAEFVRICTEACSDPDAGLRFAKKLDESGAVIVLGKNVCVKPQQVAKAIQDLILIPGATRNDAKMRELEYMEKQKSLIDQKADALVRRELWLGLGFLAVQTAGFMRLTFWELSWDVMEPICFYVTSMYFMGCYAFFLRTSKEPSFEGFFQSRFAANQKKVMKDYNFDFARYEELRKACLPVMPSSSDNLSQLLRR